MSRPGRSLGVIFDGRGGYDTLTGGAGDDVLAGGEGADTISGGAGDDTLIVDEFDTFDGGDGIDTVYLGTESDVTMNVTDYNVEILFAGSGNDTISTAQNRAAALYGGGGNDVCCGS